MLPLTHKRRTSPSFLEVRGFLSVLLLLWPPTRARGTLFGMLGLICILLFSLMVNCMLHSHEHPKTGYLFFFHLMNQVPRLRMQCIQTVRSWDLWLKIDKGFSRQRADKSRGGLLELGGRGLGGQGGKAFSWWYRRQAAKPCEWEEEDEGGRFNSRSWLPVLPTETYMIIYDSTSEALGGGSQESLARIGVQARGVRFH